MRRLALVGACAAVLALVGLSAAPAAASPDQVVVVVPGAEERAVADAQLRWGLNAEAGSGAFAGGCNFLSAGVAGDTGGSRVWGAGDGLYNSRAGAVRIEKPNAAGEWVPASFETRCLDPQGRVVTTSSTTSTTGNQVVMDGGTGSIRAGGSIEIRWSGSFTVAFYGGMTYWSVADPVLTVDASGAGRLVGTASGYGTSMDDMTQWDPIAPRSIVLAEVRGVNVSAQDGFVVLPEFLGVGVTGGGQVERAAHNEAYWGSFPQGFVDFQALTGQRAYWLTSGGVRDRAKPATEMYVSYDAAAPIAVPPPANAAAAGGGQAANAPSNPVRRPPAVAPVTGVPAVPLAPVAVNDSVTTLPAPRGLVPNALAVVSPLVPPLLGTAAALGASIVAVLSLMRALPWQRRLGA